MQSTFAVYPELDALPRACAELFESESGFALRAERFRNLIDTGLAQRKVPLLSVRAAENRPLAIVRFLEGEREGIQSLINRHISLYRPLIPDGAWLTESAFVRGMTTLARHDLGRAIPWARANLSQNV